MSPMITIVSSRGIRHGVYTEGLRLEENSSNRSTTVVCPDGFCFTSNKSFDALMQEINDANNKAREVQS